MKLKKILASILAIAMVLSTMGTVVFAADEEVVAHLASTGETFTTLQAAFDAVETMTGENQIVMDKDVTENIVLDGKGYSLYMDGHTLTGQIKIINGGLTLRGHGTRVPSNRGKIVAPGTSESTYPIYCVSDYTNSAHVYFSQVDIEASDSNGTAIYMDSDALDVQLISDVVVTGNIQVNKGVFVVNEADDENINKVTGTLANNAPGAVDIDGGLFSNDPSNFLVAGFKAEETADGWKVVRENLIQTTEDFDKDADGAYLIKTAEQMVIFHTELSAGGAATFLGKVFKIANDIDLSGKTFVTTGNKNNRFAGTLDGQNYTLSNLTIDGAGKDYAAFIGSLAAEGTVKNIKVENATVTGATYTAVLVGQSRAASSIENCHISGDINVTGTGSFVAGIVGGAQKAGVNDCSVSGTGTISGDYVVGGIIGIVSEGMESINNNSVNGVSVTGNERVGGIAGSVLVAAEGLKVQNNAVENVTVSGSTADAGLIIGQYNKVAGKVEIAENTVVSSSATEAGVPVTNLYGDNLEVEYITFVAKIGTEYYSSIQAALAAVKSGDTLVLLDDVTVAATNGGYRKAGITQIGFDIDGNGHTLNVTGANTTWDCAIYTRGGTIKNLTIASGFRGVFTAGQDADIILDNVTIEGPTYTISADDGNKAHDFIIKNSTLNGWTSYTDKFASVTFENCTFGEGAGYAYMRPYADTTYIGCDFTDDYSVDARADVKMTDCTIDGTPMTAEDVAELLGGSAQANIGSVYYDSINDAFAAAVDGDTITLLANATPTLTSQRAITKASVIDLNGKTLTLTEDDLYFGTTTFKNGNIVVDPSVKASTAVFWMFANQTLTFDNVDITATGVTGTYLMGINGGTGSAINILNGTNIIIDNDTVADLTAVICDNGTDNNITIKGSNIDVNNIEGRFYLGGSNGNVSVENSIIDLDGVKEGFYLRAGQELDIAGTSNVNVKLNNTNGRYGINLTDATANYTVDDTATVNASIYKAPATDGSNLAKKVKLSFEATDKQEVYNIYAEAVDGTINRLSAVQVKFALDNPRMSYTLAPATDLGVTLTNDLDDEEAYVFNFNGETAADATGAKLLIGTVTFGGYGNFNFTVDASFNNKIKTAQTTDNIVEEYVPAPDAANEKQGTFDIASSAITGAAVVEAKRDVKVVIDFNNDITAGNDADYNDMTVTLTGSNGEVHTAQVGDLVNGQPNYTEEKAEMTFNVTAGYRYTVVVKGEGYRTARYSTNVDASDDTLVLTFWNNALENADRTERFDYIEEGVERSKKSVTFLAGDIAQDNIIDKYDLAAVVSYFGFDNLKTTNPNYVKYDLNRDGKIDADDISYVLVSWGK